MTIEMLEKIINVFKGETRIVDINASALTATIKLLEETECNMLRSQRDARFLKMRKQVRRGTSK